MQQTQWRPAERKHSGFAPSANQPRGLKRAQSVVSAFHVGRRRTGRCQSRRSARVLDSIPHGATRPSPDANYRPSISTKGTSLRQGSNVHEISERVAVDTAATSGLTASLTARFCGSSAGRAARRKCAKSHRYCVNDDRLEGRCACRGLSPH